MLEEILSTAKQRDIVIIACDMNARIGRLSSNKARLDGLFSLDSCLSGNEERLLTLCSDHHFFCFCELQTFRSPVRHLASTLFQSMVGPNRPHLY